MGLGILLMTLGRHPDAPQQYAGERAKMDIIR
jgi:hypothetical protein